MWSLEQLIVLTLAAAVAVSALTFTASYGSFKSIPGRPVLSLVAAITVTIATAIMFGVGLNHLWEEKRERDARISAARGHHLQRLRDLLRTESESLNGLARALHEGRYFTLVANDARKAIWEDGVLSNDVGRHFPEYFQEREQLIREILAYDTEMGRVRELVSASLPLTGATEPFRADLVSALVNKCGGGAAGVSLARMRDAYTSSGATHQPAGSRQSISFIDPVQTYEQYRCGDISPASRSLLDRAEDLADSASALSDTARRHAEETVLHGSCTYAPGGQRSGWR